MAEREVVREVVLDAPVEEAWELVGEAEGLEAWLADEVELDAREGGEVAFGWDDGARRPGVVEEVDPPRRLAFRWGEDLETRVELDLAPLPDGRSRLTVRESGWGLALPGRAAGAGPRLQAAAAASGPRLHAAAAASCLRPLAGAGAALV